MHGIRPLLSAARLVACLLVPLGVSPTGAAEEEATPAPRKPNLMIFLVDDMGVMDTSVPFLTDENGEPQRHPLNAFHHTPSMERLARRGIRFEQFYAMSVCSPTRISLLTGQNAARHRTTNWINPWNDNAGPHGPPDWNWRGLRSEDVTLPAILRTEGYRTLHVGKGHLGPEGAEGADPARLGFDANIAGASFGAPGSYHGEENFGRGTKRERHAVPHLDAYHGTPTFLTEALTREARRLVAEAVADDRPFFLHFSHYAVHAPFQSDPRFAERYRDSGRPAPAQAFATLIEGMDKSLGDMIDQFESLGIAENTLILFLGDNGSDAPLGHQHEVACAAPLRGRKGSHYEGGMRVPFIAAWARPNPDHPWQRRLPIAAGTIQTQVANVTDLFPTLLELVTDDPARAVPAHHVVDGSPLDVLLTGRHDPSRREQFLMHYPHAPHRSNYFTAWRDGDWKLVHHALPAVPTTGGRLQVDGGPYQLFHLATDPSEQHDLADREPETLHRLAQGMIEQLDAMNATHPVDDHGRPIKPSLP